MTLFFAGLALGSIYALVAIGYNIVFTASHSFNFAQAQLMMVGAYVVYTGSVTYALPVVAVVCIAAAVVMALAVLEERIAIRPVSDHQTQLITTLGFGTVLTGVVQIVWGAEPHAVPFFAGAKTLSLAGAQVQPVDIGVFCFTAILVVAARFYSRHTMTGRVVIAMSQDEEAVRLRGVNTRLMRLGAFAVTGLLAGVMAFFVGPKTYAVATLGSSLALKGFVALTIGGTGSFYGAFVGGLATGLAEECASRYWGTQYANLSVFFLLLVVLTVRPSGLFGRYRERMV